MVIYVCQSLTPLTPFVHFIVLVVRKFSHISSSSHRIYNPLPFPLHIQAPGQTSNPGQNLKGENKKIKKEKRKKKRTTKNKSEQVIR